MEEERSLSPRDIAAEQAEIKAAMKNVRRRRRGPLLLGIMDETFAGLELFNFLKDGLDAAREINTSHSNAVVSLVSAVVFLGFFGYFEWQAFRMWRKIQGSNEQLHILGQDLRNLRRVQQSN